MCGICGYIGNKDAVNILCEGLSRLEYRGYDSAGIAVIHNKEILITKSVGRLDVLERKCRKSDIEGNVGIGHTRWATHGKVSEENAHPHQSYDGSCVVVHNGIIENYREIKSQLIKEGVEFKSDTDTEVITHLFAKHYNGVLKDTIFSVLGCLQGTYGLLILHKDHPHHIIGACHGSPMVIARIKDAMILASDPSVLRRYSDHVIYMEEKEIVELTQYEYAIYNKNSEAIKKTAHKLEWNVTDIEKGNYATFMEKEIHEHPFSVRNALMGRIHFNDSTAILSGMNLSLKQINSYTSVKILSIGTSYYAGEVGAMLIENIARIPASAELSSEFIARNPVINDKTLYLVISQSGETYDTILALREIMNHGVAVRGICNSVGSTISRETEGGSFTHSGVEISVASTKSLSGQLTVLYLLALKIARARGMSFQEGKKFIHNLHDIPEKMGGILLQKHKLKELAKKHKKCEHIMFLGRGMGLPIAREAALKVKEIAYIHAQAYSSAEMKHGPIALIDNHFPAFFLACNDYFSMKMKSNIQEIKARGGYTFVIAPENMKEFEDVADNIFYIPTTHEFFCPFLLLLPIHLFSLYMAEERMLDVDKPRNLAKSVTVE